MLYIFILLLSVEVGARISNGLHSVDFTPQEIKLSKINRMPNTLPGSFVDEHGVAPVHEIHRSAGTNRARRTFDLKNQRLSPDKVLQQNSTLGSQYTLLPVLLPSLVPKSKRELMNETGPDHTNEDLQSDNSVKSKPGLLSTLTRQVKEKAEESKQAIMKVQDNASKLNENGVNSTDQINNETVVIPSNKSENSSLIVKETGTDYAVEDIDTKPVDANATNKTKILYSQLHQSLIENLLPTTTKNLTKEAGSDYSAVSVNKEVDKGEKSDGKSTIKDGSALKEYTLPLTAPELKALNILVSKRMKELK